MKNDNTKDLKCFYTPDIITSGILIVTNDILIITAAKMDAALLIERSYMFADTSGNIYISLNVWNNVLCVRSHDVLLESLQSSARELSGPRQEYCNT